MDDQDLTQQNDQETDYPHCDKIIDTDPLTRCGVLMQKNGTSRGGQSWICPECGTTQSRFKQKKRGRPIKFNSVQERNKYHNDLKAKKKKAEKEQEDD